MEKFDGILWAFAALGVVCLLVLIGCAILWVRNNRVFTIRQTLGASSCVDWRDLPSYEAMMMPRYWHLWTVQQWLKWLEIKRSENIA